MSRFKDWDYTTDNPTTMSLSTEASVLSVTAFLQQLVAAGEDLLLVLKRCKSAKQESVTRAEAKVHSEWYNQHFKKLSRQELTYFHNKSQARAHQLPHCPLTRLLLI